MPDFKVLPLSIFHRAMIARMIAPTSAAAASAKYHQCGCRSTTIVSSVFSSFRGYGMA